MDKITIERYDPSLACDWDVYVGESRNGTFLHLRGYMDYHSDRFRDCSLLARSADGRVLALLPANVTGDGILQSHGGLTYGGWLTTGRKFDGAVMLGIMESLTDWARREGVKGIDYRPVPWIYHRVPSEEDRYALWRCGYRLRESHLSSAVFPGSGFHELQRRQLRKAQGAGVEITESQDWAGYWQLLGQCLQERHGVAPVHTLEEMRLLQGRFPDRIRLFAALKDGEMQAGTVVYDTGLVAHTQYIATSASGRQDGSLPLLVDWLKQEFATRRCIDFGVSTERGGLPLNEGLHRQKTGLGGTGVVYERYYLPLTDD